MRLPWRISHDLAKKNAEQEYHQFKTHRLNAIEGSDFEQAVNKIEQRDKNNE